MRVDVLLKEDDFVFKQAIGANLSSAAVAMICGRRMGGILLPSSSSLISFMMC
jgi:hypothetical protein